MADIMGAILFGGAICAFIEGSKKVGWKKFSLISLAILICSLIVFFIISLLFNLDPTQAGRTSSAVALTGIMITGFFIVKPARKVKTK